MAQLEQHNYSQNAYSPRFYWRLSQNCAHAHLIRLAGKTTMERHPCRDVSKLFNYENLTLRPVTSFLIDLIITSISCMSSSLRFDETGDIDVGLAEFGLAPGPSRSWTVGYSSILV